MMHDFSSARCSSLRSAGLWLCRACFEVQLLDATLGVSRHWEQQDDRQVDADDEREAFLYRHVGHPLTPLKKNKDCYYSDRPVWDPLRVAYEEVMDGRETFVLKSWRTHLDEPRQYALRRGTLDITTTVQLPAEPLREELAQAFSCSLQQADKVVERLQRVVAALPPEELLPAYCAADDPHLTLSYLNENQLQRCIKLCQTESEVFDKMKLRDFFAWRQQEDVLMLEVRHYYQPQFS